MTDQFKSGFISIVGRPNVGKSTLMNHILGEKVAITSDKVQTTRNKIQGVYTTDSSQMIFIDTPGIHKPHHRLGQRMVDMALSSLGEVDVILFVVNVTQKKGSGDQFIMNQLKGVNTPVILVLNQIDRISPNDLPDIATSYQSSLNFDGVVPISALQGNNIAKLLETIETYLEPGPQYYPSDQLTDHPEYFIVSELIREKILELTEEEIPHSVAVQIESMKRRNDRIIDVSALIIVERSSQKGIIIGKGGRMIREIGSRARQDIERLLGDQIYLDLFVKVSKNWRNKPVRLEELGYAKEEY